MSNRYKPYIYIGRRVRFDPMKSLSFVGCEDSRGTNVSGTVIYVNRPHKWFCVESGGLRTCFFFRDIGKEVFTSGA